MELDRLWKNTQEELRVVMAPAVFQTFVAKTQLIALKNNTATIACPNSYLVDINHKRYRQLFQDALDNQTKAKNKLQFILQPHISSPSNSTKNSSPLFSFTPTTTSTTPNLHPQYTFDNFIVGNSNNYAYAAAQGIVKNPGLTHNPFFIWGGVGLGKTHLMQAIGHQIIKDNPQFKIRYFPAETFGNELISALKSKKMNQFKTKYRQLDCILVDDVQFLAGKEYTQEEFFHTFNALHMAGKQVILTSDRKPNDINKLEDRLVSRFMGGLTVDIQLPDYEMRVAIIKQKAEKRKINITDSAVQFLSEKTESNIRGLEGQLQKIHIQAVTQKIKTIDLTFIQAILDPTSSPTHSTTTTITPRHLVSVCAKHFGVKTGDLCGQGRQKEIVLARHITAYLLLTEIKLPLKQVGQILGGRDHTSIMHARDKIHTQLSTNPPIRQLINQIKKSL